MKITLPLMLAALLLSGCGPEGQRIDATPAATKSTEPQAQWDASYGGADKGYDSALITTRDQVAPTFRTLRYADESTGRTMEYSLYAPKGHETGQKFPLVVFIADASTVGKGVKAPLMQGYGGIVWATEASQAKHPAYVLVPSFAGPEWATNDNWQISDEVGVAHRLIRKIIAEYDVDPNRVYATGQSMGGMISFYLNATDQNLFASSMFVGSQWDTKVLAPLAKDRFIYVVSAGDAKASAGMHDLGELLASLGAKYAEVEFPANLPQAQQDELAADLLAKGLPINFIRFTPGTVAPPRYLAESKGSEHMYSFDHAYLLEPARNWLFQQSR